MCQVGGWKRMGAVQRTWGAGSPPFPPCWSVCGSTVRSLRTVSDSHRNSATGGAKRSPEPAAGSGGAAIHSHIGRQVSWDVTTPSPGEPQETSPFQLRHVTRPALHSALAPAQPDLPGAQLLHTVARSAAATRACHQCTQWHAPQLPKDHQAPTLSSPRNPRHTPCPPKARL